MQPDGERENRTTTQGGKPPKGPSCSSYFSRIWATSAIDQAAGKVQEGFGTAKRKTQEFIEDVTDEDGE
jgi:hypothetical protein